MSETMSNAPEVVIKVIGLGGCGGNAVDYMIANGLSGVEFIYANTDTQALKRSRAAITVPLGKALTKGLGAGANPIIGRKAALADRDRIAELIDDADMLFIIAGMGGGTGAGAAPVVAEIAKELGILTVAVVTKPFGFEGKRMKVALEGIEALSQHVDSLIVIPNDKLVEVLGGEIGFREAFKAADGVLHATVAGIVELIKSSGIIGVDFADIRTVMSEMGMAMMGSAQASGVDRARKAAEQAVTSPLLEDANLLGARAMLVNVTASEDMQLEEVYEVMNTLRSYTAEDATVIFGTVFDKSLRDNLRVTILALGIDAKEAVRESQPRVAKFEALQMKEQVAGADRKIRTLKQKLETASGEEREKLEQKLAHERSQREAADEKRIEAEKKLAIQEAEIDRLKTDLMGRVQNSIGALKNSLETTDGNIKNNKHWSMVLKVSALICFLGATLALLWVMAGLLLPSMGMKDALLHTFKELQYLSLIVTTFPVLVLLAIGTALLRHDTRVMREIRSYAEQKHQIERMAGLLQSAQYAAQDLDKSKDYVEDTFTKIRDRLIAMTGNEKVEDKEHDKGSSKGEESDGIIGGLKAFKDVLELLKGGGTPKP